MVGLPSPPFSLHVIWGLVVFFSQLSQFLLVELDISVVVLAGTFISPGK